MVEHPSLDAYREGGLLPDVDPRPPGQIPRPEITDLGMGKVLELAKESWGEGG